MKNIVIAALLMIAFAGTALSSNEIVFPAKTGNVTFPHKKHQITLKNCRICHENGPGKIKGFDKDLAHKLCMNCHENPV